MSAANEADFFAESSLTKQDISSLVCQDDDAYNEVQHDAGGTCTWYRLTVNANQYCHALAVAHCRQVL